MLFSELTPARLDLLNTLRGMGPASVYALAETATRNYSKSMPMLPASSNGG